MSYGDVTLGVECALPAGTAMARRKSAARRAVAWLVALFINRI